MKINKKFLNWSAWLTLLITYVFPYHSQSKDGFATYFGYPFPFLTIYKTPIHTSLLKTEALNLLSLALDILIVYLVINYANILLTRLKSKKDMNKPKFPQNN